MQTQVENNVEQLDEMLATTKSQLPFSDNVESEQYLERKEIVYTQQDISNLTGIPLSRIKKAIEEAEQENGAPYLRLANSWYQLSQYEAVELVKKFNIFPMKDLREKFGVYDVPVICVHKGKGGIGKTTTSIALAVNSATDIVKAKRTLLIDGDPQGSVRHFMLHTDLVLKSVNSVGSIFKNYAHLSRQERLNQDIQKEIRDLLFSNVIFESNVDNLWFTPALMSDTGILITICEILGQKGNTFDDAITLYKDLIITPLKNDFDIIFIDTSPACDPVTYSLYYASNYLIIPTTGRTQDFKAYQEYLSLSKLIIQRCMPKDFKGFHAIRTLLTKHLKNNEYVVRNSGSILSSHHTFNQVIEENKVYEKASKEQLPILLLNSKTKAHREAVSALNQLHALIMKMIEPHLFPETEKKQTPTSEVA